MHTPAGSRRWRLDAADHDRLLHAAEDVFEAEPAVLAAYLYGSAARGEPAGDLDIAVLVDGPVSPSQLEALAASLQAKGAPAGPPIDLRPLDQAAPRFQINVLKDGRVLYERDRHRRLRREAAFMSRWADFKPTWERMRRRMLDRWIHG
jgi:predicted nucleotidyltransferase